MQRSLLQRLSLLRWQIRDDQPTNATGRRILTEAGETIGQQWVVVAHQDQRHAALGRNLARNLHTATHSHAALKGLVTRVLDRRAIGQRIAKGHTQLNNVRSCLSRSQRHRRALLRRRIATHRIGDQHASLLTLCPIKRLANTQRVRGRGRRCRLFVCC